MFRIEYDPRAGFLIYRSNPNTGEEQRIDLAGGKCAMWPQIVLSRQSCGVLEPTCPEPIEGAGLTRDQTRNLGRALLHAVGDPAPGWSASPKTIAPTVQEWIAENVKGDPGDLAEWLKGFSKITLER